MTTSDVIHFIAWHYTNGSRLDAIIASGKLKPGEALLAKGERPMLWFSTHHKWEPTTTMMVRECGALRGLTFKELSARIGCVRFGLPATDSRLLDWGTACALAGTPDEVRARLEHVGRMKGANPAQWFASADAVPLADLRFERYLNGRWTESQMGFTKGGRHVQA